MLLLQLTWSYVTNMNPVTSLIEESDARKVSRAQLKEVARGCNTVRKNLGSTRGFQARAASVWQRLSAASLAALYLERVQSLVHSCKDPWEEVSSCGL